MYERARIPLGGSPVAETILPFILDIAGVGRAARERVA
jgi:hypothetical protein